MSKIEWTEKTWNPLAGCDKVSAGCKNCYAMQMAFRLTHMGQKKYDGTAEKTAGGQINWTGKINLDYSSLQIPFKTKKPTVYFVNSMSDLFHMNVPFDFIYKVFEAMHLSHWHTFQVLTKRADRLHELKDVWFHLKRNYPEAVFPSKNVWVGVSVEDQKAADERIPQLLQAPAAVRFLSCEPLLGNLFIPHYLLKGIHWVICGGESGREARPMHPDWARSLRDQCQAAGVPFFFKQWGNWLPFEQDAQPPFWNACSNGESFDAHGMNFTDENGNPGKWMSGKWIDSMEAILLCEEHKSSQCMFLNLPKTKISRKLDGRTHDEMPPYFFAPAVNKS